MSNDILFQCEHLMLNVIHVHKVVPNSMSFKSESLICLNLMTDTSFRENKLRAICVITHY